MSPDAFSAGPDDPIGAVAKRLPPEAQAAFSEIVNLIAAGELLQGGDHFKALWEKGVGPSLSRAVSAALNEVFLFRQQLELTSHGIARSFRFWTQEEKTAYLGAALDMISHIQANASPDVCLCYGTALAVGRSEELIPHDDDIDLMVAFPRARFEKYQDAAEALADSLSSTQFHVQPAEPYVLHVKAAGIEHKFDIFVALEEDGYIASFPGPRKLIFKNDVFPPASRSLFSKQIPVPARLDTYLAKVYGPDWRTPDPAFSHNWSTDHHADLF